MERPCFSLVIPFWNIDSSYIKRLVGSIPVRKDVQILLIDDGSDDKLSEFVGSLCSSDTRISYYRFDEHHGVGYIRNKAIELADGEWIIYADSDDQYDIAALDRALDIISKQSEYDVVIWGADTITVSGERAHNLYGYEASERLIPIADRSYFLHHSFECWRKVVRLSWLKKHDHVRNSYLKIFEDVKYSIELLLQTESVAIYPSIVYHYYRREGSALSIQWSREILVSCTEELLKCCRLLESKQLLKADFGPMRMILQMLRHIDFILFVKYLIRYNRINSSMNQEQLTQIIFDTYETSIMKAFFSQCIVFLGFIKRRILKKR